MRLPGTRYQEPGWEEVRKLLGLCSLALLRAGTPTLEDYVDAMARQLRAQRGSARAQAAGNSYGDTVHELALALVYELRARPAEWDAFCTALAGEGADIADALLRKKANDMYAVLRDKVDADNYQAACGRPCSANRIYAYRMLDMAYADIARLFANWTQHRGQVAAILGRDLGGAADMTVPIEVRQLRTIGDCRPEWLLRWSATLADYGGTAGPLHTRSKRFASLKTSPEKIGAMLREIGEYEALSANRDHDWLQDRDDAGLWIEDYWRVLQDADDNVSPGPDRILEARADALDAADEESAADAAPNEQPDAVHSARLESIASTVSLPPGYMQAAAAAEDTQGWARRAMADDGLAVRLAVYARLLGPSDDSYPEDWRDPASGALPTMQQLAALAEVSLPTLRKRRDAAIARLSAATMTKGGG